MDEKWRYYLELLTLGGLVRVMGWQVEFKLEEESASIVLFLDPNELQFTIKEEREARCRLLLEIDLTEGTKYDLSMRAVRSGLQIGLNGRKRGYFSRL